MHETVNNPYVRQESFAPKSFAARFYASRCNRYIVMLTWLVLCGAGVLWGLKFTAACSSDVAPSKGTLAEAAQKTNNAHFPPGDQTLIVVVESKNGKPLIDNWTVNGTNLDCRADYLGFSNAFDSAFEAEVRGSTELNKCNIKVTAFCTMNNSSRIFLRNLVFSDDTMISLMSISAAHDCDGKTLAKTIEDVAKKQAAPFPTIAIQPTGGPALITAVQEGVATTMGISTKTFPFALFLVAVFVQNVRLTICILCNILATLLVSFLIMYPIALSTPVTNMTPSLMLAAILAMSIDYSLFLLSRFGVEIKRGQPVHTAVTTMLETSGRIVVISGLTLTVCFLTMLMLPSSFISTMGVGASVSVLMAIVTNLTITPSLILTFPNFFSSFKWYGLSCEGCCCSRSRPPSSAEIEQSLAGIVSPSIKNDYRQSRYYCLARMTQRYGGFVLILLVALAFPVMMHVGELTVSEGVEDLMPRETDATNALQTLEGVFGANVIFATSLLMQPPFGLVTDATWLHESCLAVKAIAKSMGTDVNMFSGIMIVKDNCVDPVLVDLALEVDWVDEVETLCNEGEKQCKVDCANLFRNHNFSAVVCPEVCKAINSPFGNTTLCGSSATGIFGQLKAFANGYVSEDHQVAKVTIKLESNPFDEDGQSWIDSFRKARDEYYKSRSLLGTAYLFGQGPIQMDTGRAVLATFPAMIATTIAIVFVLLGIAFQSLVVPLRAVLCLSLMLAFTFGLAVMTYQNGAFDGLGIGSLSHDKSNALYWMSPMISFSVMVGLGLDYDVFLIEAILEERQSGLSDSEATMSGLIQTGNIISIAGVVMIVAFASLLLSATPGLNQIAFLLLVGIIIDCFITTKLIIPSAMALLGKYNFWPRVFPTTRSIQTADPDKNPIPVGWRLCCDRQKYEYEQSL